jgi:hypothetical protein
MTSSPETVLQTGVRAGETVSRSPAFEVLSRSGFVARALIYGIIGVLALKLALGDGGKTVNQQGALKTLVQQPFGKVMLVLVAIGLAGYALWRLTRAALGHGPEGSDSGFERVGALASGLVYAGIFAIAVKILLGSGGGSGNAHKATAGVLGWPAGTWLVGLAGVVFIGVGAYQAYRGLTHDFLDDAKTEQMGPAIKSWVTFSGTFGYLARAVVFGLVGVFLIKAAVDFDPQKAVGIDGALAKLSNTSHGSIVLGVVAAGLIAFAVYSLSDARYRRI